jgi:2-hydroxychromene-2-carboxylate isomerase
LKELFLKDKSIEIWYEFGSNYSYLSVMRIGKLAQKSGVSVVWQPFLLGPIFKSFGWESSPFVLQVEKGRYTWRDMERQCEKYSLPWTKPTNFPRRALLPMRVAVLGKKEVWIEEFSKQMFALNFVHDVELDSVEMVTKALTDLGLDAQAIIEQASTPENKENLKRQTEAAQKLGIFGGPSFIAGGELFWGNDRLDEALEWAAKG